MESCLIASAAYYKFRLLCGTQKLKFGRLKHVLVVLVAVPEVLELGNLENLLLRTFVLVGFAYVLENLGRLQETAGVYQTQA